ncbi:MAG: TIGR02710 family CRISPR-associated CARF protein [Bacillota bacterium]|jgi:CRISPR-associated protein (TIGR02710 family)
MSDLGQLRERLKQASDLWQSLPLETREEQAIAMEFYSKAVFPLSKQVFVATEASKIKEPIYGLILPVGTSPEPLILSISAVNPERVLFLYTEKTESMLDTIVEHTGLRPSQWEKRLVDPADVTQIYCEIKDVWNRWEQRREIAVDLTGGTKTMTCGSALAGTLVGAQLIYIANREYLLDPYRRPEPGSEYIEFVPNPYNVFGDLDEKEAMNRFRRHDFAGAALVLANLAKKAAYPRRYEALASLSAAYKAWDEMNFLEACFCMRKTIDIIEMLVAHDGTVPDCNLANKIQPLRAQLEGLEHVKDLMPSEPGEPPLPLLEDCNATASLIFTIYASAERKATRGEYDTASLLLYRLVELMAQRRLAVYGIDTGNPHYAKLESFKLDQLVDNVNNIRSKLEWSPISSLPNPIPLTEAYILLQALNDPYGLAPAGVHWNRFLNETGKRNHSILAHGFIFISEDQYMQFKQMVDPLLELFCSVEGIGRSQLHTDHTFIDPWIGI